MKSISGRPLNVIIADDDEDDLFLFREAMNDCGLNFILNSVTDGHQLMDFLKSNAGRMHPDIIFLDINMPVKNGKECLKEIRTNNSYSTVPIVMYTTSAYRNDIDETFNYGANLYIIKGNTIDDDKKVINKIFSEQHEKLLAHNKSNYVFFAQAM